jgi:hypothetical protein
LILSWIICFRKEYETGHENLIDCLLYRQFTFAVCFRSLYTVSLFCYTNFLCQVLSALRFSFYPYLHSFWLHLSREIVVSVATWLGTGGWTIRDAHPDWVNRFLCCPNRPYRLWDPLSLLINGHRPSFLAVKRPRRDVDHPPLSNVVVKNKWSYTSTPSTCFQSIDRENFFLPFRFHSL